MKSAATFSSGLLALLVLSTLAADKPSEDDLQKLQGTWIVVTGSNDGDDYAAGGKFIVEGAKYKIQRKDGSEAGAGLLGSTGTFKLDASKSPKQIDLTYKDFGSDLTDKGIYELEAGTLKICSNPDSRPKKYESPKGAFQSLLILKKK